MSHLTLICQVQIVICVYFLKVRILTDNSNMQLPVHIYKFLSIISLKKSFNVFEGHINVSTNYNLEFCFGFFFLNLFPDNGIVLKVITIYNQETESMEEVILEELQVFKVNCAVYEIYIQVLNFLQN